MALGKFGVKEVADVRFYPANALKINATTGKLEFGDKSDGSKYTEADKKLEFTTLKVSNLEITAETTDEEILAATQRGYAIRNAKPAARFRDRLIELYGKERGSKIRLAEAYEVSEYGSPMPEEMKKELMR